MKSKSSIFTYSGRQVDPLNFKADMIHLEDIAHSLANQCRFTGHTKFHYSVAQHSVYCSYVDPLPPILGEKSFIHLSSRQRLGLLLHDSAEAYLADLARPIKINTFIKKTYLKNVQEGPRGSITCDGFEDRYQSHSEVEDKVLRVIFDHYGISDQFPLEPFVKEIDNRLLFTEKRDLFTPQDWGWEVPPLESTIKAWDPAYAKDQFLSRFEQLSKTI